MIHKRRILILTVGALLLIASMTFAFLPKKDDGLAVGGTIDREALCAEDTAPSVMCSDAWEHRFDRVLYPERFEKDYKEIIWDCNVKTVVWRDDGKHPDGSEVVTVLPCEDDEIEPTATSAAGD